MITIFNGDTRGFKGVSKGYFLQIELQMRDYIREFTGNEWLMFSILMLYMKPDGRATPSEELLLEKSGLQRETVYKLLARLKDKEINGQRILLRYQPIVSGRKQGAVNILFPTDEEIEEYEARYAKREPHTDFPHTDDPDPVPPARLPIKEALSLEDNFKGAEVVNPQSQAPTLQDSLDESVGSHQRIGDSLVKTLGEDPEIEIEMADEEEIFNESPDAKAIRKGAAKKSKPKTSSWNTSAPKNKSSLETPTPQGNNSSPHSARPPSDAWLEALTPSQRLVAENVGERGWDRSLKLLPSRLKDYANVDMALMEQLLDQAKLATVGKEPQFRANTIVQELDRLLLASRVKTGSSHGWTSWHITTTALGRKQWTRSLVNPITQMNEYQTADYDADSPDGGKPKEQA